MPDTLTNRPPENANPLRDRLAETYADALLRCEELLDGEQRVPNPITSEADAKRVSDYIRDIAKHTKVVEAYRVAEKEPFLESSRTVDGWFKEITEPLKKAKAGVESILTAYQRKKAEQERKAREAAERAAREEAERLRLEAERAAQEAQNEAQLDQAIADADAAQAAQEAAAAAQRAADAKAAELSRTRGSAGAVASLRTFWDFRDMDRAALDLEALRQHLPEPALESAVRSFIKAGGRELAGVVIFENTKTVVR